MRVTVAVAAALLAAMLSAVPAEAADPPAGTAGVPTVTRLVKIFLDKEAAVGAAIRAADATALGALLTDDFELRDGSRVATPVPREEWMRDALASRNSGGEIHGMAVHDFGTVAIASFTQTMATGEVLVVDVWRAAAGDWKLAVRYSGNAGVVRPRAERSPRQQEIPKKY
jgi:hypothetical protein